MQINPFYSNVPFLHPLKTFPWCIKMKHWAEIGESFREISESLQKNISDLVPLLVKLQAVDYVTIELL